MSPGAGTEALHARTAELIAARTAANREYFEAHAEGLAHVCHLMAERFARGGRLVALGNSPAARSDVRHITVEFVHPVIVGKRALPAIGLSSEGGPLLDQVDLTAEPDDIAIGFPTEVDPFFGSGSAPPSQPRPVVSEVAAAMALARERGCLTLAFAAAGAEHELIVPAELDPFIRQELAETAYHVLWELVHVFFDQRGLLSGREARATHDTGASSFLYPFLAESQSDLGAVMNDVRSSVLLKAEEIGKLRERTLELSEQAMIDAAIVLRTRLDAGGKVLSLGNGGSATDSMDLVADLRYPPPGSGWPRRRALDLTEDTAIITAVGNDIGIEEIFQRQVIAYAHEGDVLVTLSTSGGSVNVLDALTEARKRGLATIAFVGYDGGRIAAEGLADHLIVTPSQNIPRIQEAQASAYHVLRELVELAAPR